MSKEWEQDADGKYILTFYPEAEGEELAEVEQDKCGNWQITSELLGKYGDTVAVPKDHPVIDDVKIAVEEMVRGYYTERIAYYRELLTKFDE